METEAFLTLLFIFSTLTGLVVEVIKKNYINEDYKKYNLIALIVAMVIGVFGTLLYFLINKCPIDLNGLISAILMGLFSALSSMIGFDKVKQFIEQLAE